MLEMNKFGYNPPLRGQASPGLANFSFYSYSFICKKLQSVGACTLCAMSLGGLNKNQSFMKKKIIWILTISVSIILGYIYQIQTLENPSTAELLGSIFGSAFAMLAMPLILSGITYYLEQFFRKESEVSPFESTFFGWWIIIALLMTIGQYT